jgi:hypothetical protein
MPMPIRGAERAQELGISVRWRVRRITRLAAAAGLALVVLIVAGCSAGGSSSGGTNISLGLAGSTADHPSAPPSVAAAGPNDTYAFVYDDQVWLHKSGSSNQSSSCNCQSSCNPCQLTNIELSSGADISWGPLVWSPDGSHIAFALIQNLTPTTPDRSAGPIYVVNTTTVGTTVTGTTVVTPGIGSIYGHNYVWYGPNMLFYSSGDGISMYDIGDPDPRVWQVSPAMTSQDGETYTNNTVYGDIAITSDGFLYYSAATINDIGGTGAVGTAGLYRVPLPFTLTEYNDEYSQNHLTSPVAIAIWLYPDFPLPTGSQVASLGDAYSDTEGNYTMGSWQISGNGHSLVWQVIRDVDASTHTVSSSFCFSSCSTPVLGAADSYSQSIHGQLGLSPDASHVAFAGDQLYLQAVNGGNGAKQLSASGWMLTPVMTEGNSLLVATEVVSSTRDSDGVLRTDTNLVAFDGQNHYVLIAGAEDASWQ